ncbi:helix-turn-helix domain-containing protein [Liberiplasma polymorphum]|uniref:helix-turn-helix domain-containing protein n=1 Tax=Liberiplasma polymorphum TaxID=3374570 RepID=UPI003774B2E3
MLKQKENYYTINDLIKMLNVSRFTLHKYIKKKEIKAFKVGNSWRVTETELQRFIEKKSNIH